MQCSCASERAMLPPISIEWYIDGTTTTTTTTTTNCCADSHWCVCPSVCLSLCSVLSRVMKCTERHLIIAFFTLPPRIETSPRSSLFFLSLQEHRRGIKLKRERERERERKMHMHCILQKAKQCKAVNVEHCLSLTSLAFLFRSASLLILNRYICRFSP